MASKTEYTAGSAPTVWDHAAQSYDIERARDPVYSSCIRQIASQVPLGTHCCLDAGCGTGISTAAASPRCETLIAVDYSFESLVALKKKGLPNVYIVQADINALPFKDATFDACLCANTLQHLRPNGPQQRAVGELDRVTKDDKVMAVSVHHYSTTKRKAGWIKEGKPGQPGIDYIYRFSGKDLRAIIPRGSFKAVGYYRLLKIPFLGSRLQDLCAWLFGRFAWLLGHGHMLVATSKIRKRANSIYPK